MGLQKISSETCWEETRLLLLSKGFRVQELGSE